VVLDSHRPGPRFRRDIAAGEADVSDFGLGRHTLRLQVRLPGSEPYEVEGRFKVPAEVQFASKRGFLARPLKKRTPVPVGITLPVLVDPASPDDVTIDWDSFLAGGGRDEMKRVHESNAVERMHQAHPEQTAKQQADARVALERWVAAVQAGSLKRKQFDQSVDTQVRLGFLDPAEAEAARAKLDS
jgi:hypothetical protein